MQLSVAAGTDVGRIRAGNEDSLYADADQERGLFIVADGMGGHAAGEVASEMAVQIVARDLTDVRDVAADASGLRMAEALKAANRAIYERTIEEADKQGMGTTASCLMMGQGRYLIGHIGDSRVYLLRDGTFRQVTKDHSYVQEQVDAGFLTPEQARYHPYSNVITRCVGANAAVEADVLSGEIQKGDVFLVASDGLTGMVEDPQLKKILESQQTPGSMVAAMITEANRRGGLDIITAIVVLVLQVLGHAALTTTGVTRAVYRRVGRQHGIGLGRRDRRALSRQSFVCARALRHVARRGRQSHRGGLLSRAGSKNGRRAWAGTKSRGRCRYRAALRELIHSASPAVAHRTRRGCALRLHRVAAPRAPDWPGPARGSR